MPRDVNARDSTREADLKRRRRELIAVAVAATVLVAFVLAQTELPPLTRHTSLVSNLVVILLFDISFLLLGLLLLLVGRNLAKVIFEHRRGLIGSKFQVRLVLRLHRGGAGAESVPAGGLRRVFARRRCELVQSRIRARARRLARHREGLTT